MNTLGGLRANSFFDYLSNQYILSLSILLAALCGLVVRSFYPNPYTTVLPLGLVAGVGLFALLRSEKTSAVIYGASKPLLVAITLCLTAALALYTTGELQRTPAVHALTAIAYALCASLILRSPRAGVVAVICVGIAQRGMSFFASVLFMGQDSQFHLRMAQEIAEAGTIAPLAESASRYWYAPVYHVFVGMGTEILGVSGRVGAFAVLGLAVTIIPAVCLYAFGARYWTPEVGAMAGLLFTALDYPIAWAIRLRPMSLGLALFAVIILLLVRVLERRSTRLGSVLIGLLALLGIVHHSSHFMILVGLASFGAIYISHNRGRTVRDLTLISGLILFGSWVSTLYHGPGSENSLFEAVVAIAATNLLAGSSRSAVVPTSESFVVSGAATLDPVQVVPIGVVFALSCAGALLAVSRSSQRARIGLALLLTVGLLAAAALAGPLIGVSMLQPYRWWAFLFVPGALLAGVPLVALLNRATLPGRPYVTIAVVLVLIVPFAAVSGANHVGAPDNPLIDSPGADRFGTTESEAGTYEFLNGHRSESTMVTGDFVAVQTMSRNGRYDESEFMENTRYHQYREGDSQPVIREDTLIYYRDYMATWHGTYQVRVNGTWWTVYGPRDVPDGAQVYHSGSDRVIYKTAE